MMNQTKRYELWRSADGGQDTFTEAGNESVYRLLEPDERLIWVVEAASWDEAQQKRYDFMGWGRYRTIEELTGE